jgi:hypothetical protein
VQGGVGGCEVPGVSCGRECVAALCPTGEVWRCGAVQAAALCVRCRVQVGVALGREVWWGEDARRAVSLGGVV